MAVLTAAGKVPAGKGKMSTLHTASFRNSYSEDCRLTLSVGPEGYTVSSRKVATAKVGGRVETSTTETAETFGSLRSATNDYNWNLYLLAPQQHDYEIAVITPGALPVGMQH